MVIVSYVVCTLEVQGRPEMFYKVCCTFLCFVDAFMLPYGSFILIINVQYSIR